MRTAKTLIGLGGCQGWSESSLGAHSFCWFCHVTAHLQTAKTYINLWVYSVRLIFTLYMEKYWVLAYPWSTKRRTIRPHMRRLSHQLIWAFSNTSFCRFSALTCILIKQRMVGFLKISVQIKKLIHFQYQESSHTHTHTQNTDTTQSSCPHEETLEP